LETINLSLLAPINSHCTSLYVSYLLSDAGKQKQGLPGSWAQVKTKPYNTMSYWFSNNTLPFH